MSAWGRDYHVEETHMEGKNVKVQVWGELSQWDKKTNTAGSKKSND